MNSNLNLHLDDHDSDVEELWLIEAKRRLQELHSGKVVGVEAEEAFRVMREELSIS